VNHANITLRAPLGRRAYSIPKRVYERVHTLIGYRTTVTCRLIRKWSGQLCDDVNNNLCATILQTKLTDVPCIHKSAFLSSPSQFYRYSSVDFNDNESDSKRCFTGNLQELYCYFSHSWIFQVILK